MTADVHIKLNPKKTNDDNWYKPYRCSSELIGKKHQTLAKVDGLSPKRRSECIKMYGNKWIKIKVLKMHTVSKLELSKEINAAET